VHAVHRPNFRYLVTVTTVATVLAIAVTLMLAPAAGNHRFLASGTQSPSAGTLVAPYPAAVPVWSLNPLSPLLRAPATEPWTPRPRS
jgi:hypothetical protein